MNNCETLDRTQLANHQVARLQALLDPVLASNAFYRAKFKAVGVSCPEDIPDFAAFSRLPMTTRAELSADQIDTGLEGVRQCGAIVGTLGAGQWSDGERN